MSADLSCSPLPGDCSPSPVGREVAAPPAKSDSGRKPWLQLSLRQLARSDFVQKVAETYATQIVLIGVGLATTIGVARSLGPEGRGLYAVAMAMGMTGVQLGSLGLHASNTYYVAQDRSLLPTLLGNSLAVGFGFGGAIAAALYWVFRVVPRLAPVHGPLLVLGLTWIPLGLAYLLARSLLVGVQEIRSYNKVELLNRILSLSLLGLLILSRRATPNLVFGAALLSSSVGLGWTYSMLRQRVHSRPRLSLQLMPAHFALGLKAYLLALFSFLLLRIDMLMVKYFLGPEQAGYYSIASTMGDYLLMLPSIIGLILFPRLSAVADRGEKLRQAEKATIGTAVVLTPLLGLAAVTAKPLVYILFGKEFLPAVSPFLWLIPGILAMGVETTIVQYLNSLGYPSALVWIWLGATLLNMGLSVWAIPRLGISGASLVSSVSYSVVLACVVGLIYMGGSSRAERVRAFAAGGTSGV